jgi:HSP20 family protein
MDIVKSAKEIGSEIEKGAEVIANKLTDTFDNLASHLPFSNLAKKEDSSFHVEVDLPGVKKEDIDIKVEDGILSVSAIRKYKNELSRDNYYVCESSFGKFERRYVLPESIDTDKVNAKFDDGSLTIELQKTKKAKPKSISIK